LYISGALLTRAPYFEDAYISPRTRDILQDSLCSEAIQTLEGGYILNAPKLKIHLVGYYTQMKHGFNVLTFYHDGFQNFVNYALSNIDKLYFGGEFGFEANIARNITINGAAAVGRYYYNSRQQAVITVDNTAAVVSAETVYSNNTGFLQHRRKLIVLQQAIVHLNSGFSAYPQIILIIPGSILILYEEQNQLLKTSIRRMRFFMMLLSSNNWLLNIP
jgi:hypothetical protein